MRQRGILENSVLALAGDVAAKGGLAAVTFVVARALSTPEFAALAAALAVATVLTAVLDLGAQTLLTRDGVKGPEVRGSLLAALAIARLPLLGVALLVAAALGAATGQAAVALATVLLALTSAAQLSLSGALRSAQDLRPEAATRMAAGALMLLAALAAADLAPHALAVLLAVAAANLVALVPMLRAARRSTARGRPVGLERSSPRPATRRNGDGDARLLPGGHDRAVAALELDSDGPLCRRNDGGVGTAVRRQRPYDSASAPAGRAADAPRTC